MEKAPESIEEFTGPKLRDCAHSKMGGDGWDVGTLFSHGIYHYEMDA